MTHQGADAVRKGRPWVLPLENRALLVAAYGRPNLTMRQLAPLFGVSKSAADRITDHLGPMLALQPRGRSGWPLPPARSMAAMWATEALPAATGCTGQAGPV